MRITSGKTQPFANVKRPIGAKIAAVTLVLLSLMGVIAYSASLNLKQLSRELVLLSSYDIPLDQAMSDVRYYNLAQILAFERVLASHPTHELATAQENGKATAQEIGECDREKVVAASKDLRKRVEDSSEQEMGIYAIEDHCADSQIQAAINLVDSAINLPLVAQSPELIRKFTRLQDELARLPEARDNLQSMIAIDLIAIEKNDMRSAALLKQQLESSRHMIGQETAAISRQLHAYTHDAALRAGTLEQEAFWFNWGVTIGAAVVGMILAIFLTRNLVLPVRALLGGAKAIEEGDLTTHVNVESRDEIALLAQSFNFMVSGLKEKESIKATFGKYVDPRIVSTLLESQALSKAGEKRVMTVFFSDIQGFTSLSEQLTPDGLVNLLNHYFSLMSAAIQDQNGIIDKYIGDAIMAFWGAPFCDPQEHAKLACWAALEQVARLTQFRQMLPDITGLRKGLPFFNVRIGICTGDVTVGAIGSENSKNYTVIGDTVNLASRLESANKYYGSNLIISDTTYALAQDHIEVCELDRLRVYGKTEPVTIYELLARKGELNPAQEQRRTLFECGLQHYRNAAWAEARAVFDSCLKIDEHDTRAQVFLKRIESLEKMPASSEWDGVWNLEGK